MKWSKKYPLEYQVFCSWHNLSISEDIQLYKYFEWKQEMIKQHKELKVKITFRKFLENELIKRRNNKGVKNGNPS